MASQAIGDNLVRVVLECIVESNSRFGLTKIADTLYGSKNKYLEPHGLDKLRSFGRLSSLGRSEIIDVIHSLIEAGLLYKSKDKFPKLLLTNYGMDKVHDLGVSNDVVESKRSRAETTEIVTLMPYKNFGRIHGEIVGKSLPRFLEDRLFGYFTLKDSSGDVRLVLSREDYGKYSVGDVVEVINGWCKMYASRKCVTLGRNGVMNLISKSGGDAGGYELLRLDYDGQRALLGNKGTVLIATNRKFGIVYTLYGIGIKDSRDLRKCKLRGDCSIGGLFFGYPSRSGDVERICLYSTKTFYQKDKNMGYRDCFKHQLDREHYFLLQIMMARDGKSETYFLKSQNPITLMNLLENESLIKSISK